MKQYLKLHLVSINTIILNSTYNKLLAKFPGLTKSFSQFTSAKHDVKHHILIEGSPPVSSPKRFSSEKLKAAKAEFAYMVEQNICRLLSSLSPLHIEKRGWYMDHIRITKL